MTGSCTGPAAFARPSSLQREGVGKRTAVSQTQLHLCLTCDFDLSGPEGLHLQYGACSRAEP